MGQYSAKEKAKAGLFGALLQIRDEQRAAQKNARVVIAGESLPWETNPFAIMQWYLHPAIKDTVTRQYIVSVIKIPPGSRSGILRTPGDSVIYVWQGQGHSVIIDKSYTWETADVVQLPARPYGINVQHFNDDKNNPVLLIWCQPNLIDASGVDNGTEFDVLEPCPEFKD